LNLEKTQIYNGHYFVLKHLISPIDNLFASQTNLPKFLTDQLPKICIDNKQTEIILFFKSGFAADATTAYLKEYIKKSGFEKNITITKLAEGLPLYYNPDNLDQATISRALEDRRGV
jgi:recombination protein RecR